MNWELLYVASESVIKNAFLIMSKISKNYDNTRQDKIVDLLKNIIYSYDYKENAKAEEFLASVLFEILTKHKLANGNKRIAIITMFLLMSGFGYTFKETNWKIIANDIVNFTASYQGNKANKNDVESMICKWLNENLVKVENIDFNEEINWDNVRWRFMETKFFNDVFKKIIDYLELY